MKKLGIVMAIVLLWAGCAEVTQSMAPSLPKGVTMAVVPFQNYTDTPQAGERAANLTEGILVSKGYHLKSMVLSDIEKDDMAHLFDEAKKQKIDYIVSGGISEWRYKTGIDGEPAVSLQIKLYDVKKRTLVWSGTGSDSRWGHASLGTTAQDLIRKIVASL